MEKNPKMSKRIVIFIIAVISVALVLPPIISVVAINLHIYEILYPVIVSFRLVALAISIISLIHIRRGKESISISNAAAISTNLIEPILLILIGYFTSRMIAFLLFYLFPAHVFAIAIMLLPIFISSIIIACIAGKRGWLYGFFIALIQTYEFLFWDSLMHEWWYNMSFIDRIIFFTNSYQYYPVRIGFEIFHGIIGGSLGHLIGYVIRKLRKKRK